MYITKFLILAKKISAHSHKEYSGIGPSGILITAEMNAAGMLPQYKIYKNLAENILPIMKPKFFIRSTQTKCHDWFAQLKVDLQKPNDKFCRNSRNFQNTNQTRRRNFNHSPPKIPESIGF